MNDLLTQIMGSLGPDQVRQIADRLGVDPQAVDQGLKQAVPAVVTGVQELSLIHI